MGGMKRTATLLRRIADRIDYGGAPKIMHWSFTFERGEGVRFREDRRGCPLAYLGAEAYERAHTEADSAGGIIPSPPSDLVTVQLSPGRHTHIRPGETPSQADQRLLDGEDL